MPSTQCRVGWSACENDLSLDLHYTQQTKTAVVAKRLILQVFQSPVPYLTLCVLFVFCKLFFDIFFVRCSCNLFEVISYLLSCRVAGIYLQILVRIVVADMTRFAIIFAIFWVTFSGAFYLTLVGTDRNTSPTGTALDIGEDTKWDHWTHFAIFFCSAMRPVGMRHNLHEIATQSSHSVDGAGWQAKMASIKFLTLRNAFESFSRELQLYDKNINAWMDYL